MGRHRYLLDQCAQLCEALRGLAHMGVDVAFRIGMAEAFLGDGDAQSLDAARQRRDVAAGGNAALARVEAVGSGDD